MFKLISVKNSVLAASIMVASVFSAVSAKAEGYFIEQNAYIVGVATWDVLNVRAWPASYSKKVSYIPHHGTNVWVQRCIVKHGASDWCKVKYKGQWGWVNKSYLGFYYH